MEKTYTYNTVGTCSKQIIFSVNEDNKLTSCKFVRGCLGLSQGLSKLCLGQDIEHLIDKLQGIPCKGNTSCPDQLSKALTQYKLSQSK